jgi:hypothetical protein
MKRFAIILLAAVGLVGGIGVASAQMHRGSQGGAAHATGSWNSGSSWHRGGGNWHGGGSWNRGNWHGHGSRVFIGLGFGAPLWGWGWWPAYYPPSYSYYAAYPAYPYYVDYPYAYDYTAPSYIQKDAPAYGQQGSGQGKEYSYYCPDPAGYYPQVSTCAKGWLRVVPPSAPGPAAPAQR